MKLIKTIKAIPRYLLGIGIKYIQFINYKLYMKIYTRYLKRLGVKITGTPRTIAKNVHFDSSDYSLIEIGHNSTISMNVLLLTHDASAYCGFNAIDYDIGDLPKFILDKIHIGNNSFIGANSILLQGTYIGDNSIVGAGSVVRGRFPDGVIIMGNPAKVVAHTEEWIKKKINNSSKYREMYK